jgi:acyl dehydratase
MVRRVYFDDLAVGQSLRSGSATLTEADIIAFARVNDPQYFHVDPAAAQDCLFGGLVASGWQTGALTLRLLLEDSGLAFLGGVVGADAKIAWKRPVRPGDSLHIEGEITDLRPSRSLADRGFVTFRAATINQRGEAVQTIEATMLALRDPARLT